MEKRIVYISGKISGLKEAEYRANFDNAIATICEKYWFLYFQQIINPLDIKHKIKNWFFYILTDLYYLKKCTHICLMSNWKDSKGAVIEYFFAKFIFKLKIIWL